MKAVFNRRPVGFSFLEVLIATALATTMFASIIWLISTTRVETVKSVNYLRALQLAQETIAWLNAVPEDGLTNVNTRIMEGSLVDAQTGESIKIQSGSHGTDTPHELHYPKNYDSAWFYRRIILSEIDRTAPGARFMRKVTVKIYWNEGRRPDKIESLTEEPDRMRKIEMTTVLFKENEYY